MLYLLVSFIVSKSHFNIYNFFTIYIVSLWYIIVYYNTIQGSKDIIDADLSVNKERAYTWVLKEN